MKNLNEVLGGIFGAKVAEVAHDSSLPPISKFVQTPALGVIPIGAPPAPPASPSLGVLKTSIPLENNRLASNYDDAEREAIQWESEQPPDPDPTGCAGVQGFGDVTPVSSGERFRPNMRMLATQGQKIAQREREAAPPDRVQCRHCQQFTPTPADQGEPEFALGVCSITGTGQAPDKSACWPRQQRRCNEFQSREAI